jgi:hypothetical protein
VPDDPTYIGWDRTSIAGLSPLVARLVLNITAAQRAVLDLHTSPHTVMDGFCAEDGDACTHRGEAECTICGGQPCETVRLLAEAYNIRPDGTTA